MFYVHMFRMYLMRPRPPVRETGAHIAQRASHTLIVDCFLLCDLNGEFFSNARSPKGNALLGF